MENIQKIMQEAYKEIDNYEQSLINNNEIILLKKEIQTLEEDKRNAENLLRDSIKKEFRELADKFQEFKNENNIETIVNTIESPDKHFDDDYITNYIQDGFEISTFRSRFYSENLSISNSIWYNLKTIKGTVESISNLDTFRDFNKVRDEYTENSTIQKYLDLIKQLKEEQIKLEPSSKEIDKLEKQIKKMQKNKKVKNFEQFNTIEKLKDLQQDLHKVYSRMDSPKNKQIHEINKKIDECRLKISDIKQKNKEDLIYYKIYKKAEAFESFNKDSQNSFGYNIEQFQNLWNDNYSVNYDTCYERDKDKNFKKQLFCNYLAQNLNINFNELSNDEKVSMIKVAHSINQIINDENIYQMDDSELKIVLGMIKSDKPLTNKEKLSLLYSAVKLQGDYNLSRLNETSLEKPTENE